MKKFKFSLETVLKYKQQVLDALMGEHAAILALVRQQERVLEDTKRRYTEQNATFREKKRVGITIFEAMVYENGLRSLELEIQKETDKLAKLRKQEEQKRDQVVEAKKETSSLEKLKDKKFDSYQEQVRKKEEAFVEEFVNLRRIVGARA